MVYYSPSLPPSLPLPPSLSSYFCNIILYKYNCTESSPRHFLTGQTAPKYLIYFHTELVSTTWFVGADFDMQVCYSSFDQNTQGIYYNSLHLL